MFPSIHPPTPYHFIYITLLHIPHFRAVRVLEPSPAAIEREADTGPGQAAILSQV